MASPSPVFVKLTDQMCANEKKEAEGHVKAEGHIQPS
jgi:hypothetical protein